MSDSCTLSPCPLCGGTELSHGFVCGVGVGFGTAGCESCDLQVTKSTEAEAIAAWNARAILFAAGERKDPIILKPDEVDLKLVLEGKVPRCPCCQGTPCTFSRYFEHSGIYQSYVHCSWCDLQVFVNARELDEARNLAIARWSKRPTAPRVPSLPDGAFVPGPVWNDGECWTSEVQTSGGHGIVATVYADSELAATARRDVVLAALTADNVEHRLAMFLEILAAMGGTSDASEGGWTNAFCEDHEGRDPDTFNLAEQRGYTRVSHDTSFDVSTVYLTDTGRAHLVALKEAHGG